MVEHRAVERLVELDPDLPLLDPAYPRQPRLDPGDAKPHFLVERNPDRGLEPGALGRQIHQIDREPRPAALPEIDFAAHLGTRTLPFNVHAVSHGSASA